MMMMLRVRKHYGLSWKFITALQEILNRRKFCYLEHLQLDEFAPVQVEQSQARKPNVDPRQEFAPQLAHPWSPAEHTGR